MKKKHSLFNFVDILLLLFLVFTLTVFSSYNFNGNSRFDFTPKESISVTFRVKEMPKKYEENVKLKDNLYFNDDIESFGRIKYLSFTNSSVEFLDKLTNTSAIYKSPDKIDMLFSADCDAVITDDGIYTVNDIAVEIGGEIALSTPDYSFIATIIKIEKNEV